jgi:hypothetical protein
LDPASALPSVPDVGSPSRFVPHGVDAASWLDFEQRVEERRFRALLNGAQRAISAGDAASARAAIEEARDLRPDAHELLLLSGRVALLPSASVPARIPYYRWRTVRAASMLAVGVLLLMGVDWARSGDSSPVADLNVAMTAPAVPAAPLVAPTPIEPVQSESAAPQQERAVEVAEVRSDSVGTAGDSDSRLQIASVAPQSARAPVNTLAAVPEPSLREVSAPSPNGEVTDVYVAPPPRRVVVQDADVVPQIVRAAEPEVPSGARPPVPAQRDPLRADGPQAGGAANVVRQSGSVFETLGATGTSGRPTSAPPQLSAAPPAAPASAAAANAAVAAAALDQTRVQTVLDQYVRAYGRLDAHAVRTVWPSVDERALARAFSDLQSQTVSFDACDIDVNGATATAACRGTARYVTKIGSQSARTESRNVRFALTRSGDEWRIDKAETRR